MKTEFTAQLCQLTSFECERLCVKWSHNVEQLASLSGHNFMPGRLGSVPLGTAINMLIFSKAADAGFEPGVMRSWLPHLRNETLLQLGEETDSWALENAEDIWKEFMPKIWGVSEAVRPRIGPLLGCDTSTVASTICLYSQNDVEVIKSRYDTASQTDRIPRLIIRAEDLVARIKQIRSGPFFTVSVKKPLVW